MASTHSDSAGPSSPNFQLIFNNALKAYEKRIKKDLLAHPLSAQFQACQSPTSILAILQQQVQEFDRSRSSDERLTRWLDPTINVLYAFSATLGEGVGLVFSPAKVIFAGVGVLLLAARDVRSSEEALIDIFEHIENFLRRLELYTEVPPTAEMMDMMVKIMVEILSILGIATKEIKQGRTKKYLQRLVGRTKMEDALKKLDKLTHEEARMAIAQNLKMTHTVDDRVKVVVDKVVEVDDRVAGVDNRVRAVDDRVASVDNRVQVVDDRVASVDNRVQVVDARAASIDDGVKAINDKVAVAIVDGRETRGLVQNAASDLDQMKRNQLRQDLRQWLSPPDPSTNHNIACGSRHKGTAEWFFQGSLFNEWKSGGSLLWVHGNPGSGKSVLCSTVIEDVISLRDSGSASMAYFYFDFRDTSKQSRRDLLPSLVIQLSSQSDSCCDVLSRLYFAHDSGAQKPSEGKLIDCLKEMVTFPDQPPTYVIIDALDECPDSSGMPSPREQVLDLLKDLVELSLPNLHLCVTSRPEIDIRNALEHLTSRRVSLHGQTGQKKDIINYVTSVVNLDVKMQRWRDEDKRLVIETLSERAQGMFRWVFCQLEALRYCFPPSVRQMLEELPETLDETYERILREINKANREHAHRLLQCLTVTFRPLRVAELAEVLAIDFGTVDGEGASKLNTDWRWADQEQAVLSTCSSLITVVDEDGDQVIQFSHFSVKEFLTSPRLASSSPDVSRFYVLLEPAHAILAKACLGVLLQLDDRVDDSEYNVEDRFPLARYAAKHWVNHAQFENVSSQLREGMENLFDPDKPFFPAWIRVYDMDHDLNGGALYQFTIFDSQRIPASPLYYAALCGFHDLAEHLIVARHQQVNVKGGYFVSPLAGALGTGHLQVAELLYQHGADLLVQGYSQRTMLQAISVEGLIEIAEWLLSHGVNPNVQHDYDGSTPLHSAAHYGHLDAVRILLQHDADIDARDDDGEIPLHYASERGHLHVVRFLLEQGTDVNACDNYGFTPLHRASMAGKLDIARLLVEHGANVHAEAKGGRTPLQVAEGDEMIMLLSDQGFE